MRVKSWRWRAVRVLCLMALCATSLGCRGIVPVRLRVLSYNIHHGAGIDGQIDLERIAGVIRSEAPDLVALQELDRGVERSGGVNQLERLAELTGLRPVHGEHLEYGGGLYGNGVLSRLPVRSREVVELPQVGEGERRAALLVEVELPRPMGPLPPGDAADTGDTGAQPPPQEPGTLLFISTHFDIGADEARRVAAARRIEDAVAQRPAAQLAILAGDLNATPESDTVRELEAAWQNTTGGEKLWTIPAPTPQRQIDYILARPPQAWKVITTRVLPESEASDHRPILAILELDAEAR